MDSPLSVRLTLVSASPRRRELLTSLGIPFDVCPSSSVEVWNGDTAEAIAALNARRKVTRSSHYGDRGRVLLGADTLISLRGHLFGKPAGAESARRMLWALSGRWHDVITGICLSGPSSHPAGPPLCSETAIVSRVHFRLLSPAEVDQYLATGEWAGKAGAYAIQGAGASLVETLDGDFANVVGLPVDTIRELLSRDYTHCRFL